MVKVNVSDINVPELIADIWTPLNDEQREFLANHFTLQNYKKNEVIHCEGETPTHLMCLLSGKVKIYKDGVGGRDMIAVHVGDRTIVADWFVFMSGTSQIHVKALCDELEDKAAELGFVLRRREGYNEGRWIVLDFSNVLVHIFHPEEREYYNVERLWMDPAADVIRIDEEN